MSGEKSETEYPLLVPDETNFRGEYESEPSKGTAYRSYPVYDGNKFENPFDTWYRGTFVDTVKFITKRRTSSEMRERVPSKEILDKELPVKPCSFEPIHAKTEHKDDMQLTWIGHSTCVVRFDGISIMTDPVFGEYCSPIAIGKLALMGLSMRFRARFGAKLALDNDRMKFLSKPAQRHAAGSMRRIRDVPCKVADLPEDLRLVVISHNHYDHLCTQTIKDLNKKYGDKLTFCVPKGLGSWFRNVCPNIAPMGVVELTWWERANFILDNETKSKFQVVCLPAQHWSMRHPMNRNKSLWCGWGIVGPSSRRFFFAGDTGYCRAFKEIGEEMGPFDLAAIPIGAYLPRDFLKPQHVDPWEAVKVHLDIQAKKSFGVHWGTFRLGGEKTLAPRRDLATAVAENKLADDCFVTIDHGDTLTISK